MKMNKGFLRINFLLCLLLASAVHAVEKTPLPTSTLSAQIERIVSSSKVKSGQSGLYMVSAKSGEVLYQKHPDMPLNPASAIKVLVTAAALDHWGQNYSFDTQLWLNGNALCVMGGLDPYFVSESLWLMAQMIRRQATGKISSIILDNSRLTPKNKLLEDFSGDAHRAFVAPQNALALNFNALTAHVYPGKAVGSAARILLAPDLGEDAYVLKNQVKTVRSAGQKSVSLKVNYDLALKKFNVVLQGVIGEKESGRVMYASIPDPVHYFASSLKTMLHKEGLADEKTFEVRSGQCNKQGILLNHDSRPLSQIVWGMNKFSNNFMAEMLGWALQQDGVNLMDWLKQQPIALTAKPVIDNASGLSRFTKISAHDLTQVFSYAAEHPVYGVEFLHALSVAGQDGTLRNRFKSKDMLGKIRAKSGTLNNVVALTGLAKTKSYGDVYFTFIWNNSGASGWEIRDLEEKILFALF